MQDFTHMYVRRALLKQILRKKDFQSLNHFIMGENLILRIIPITE